MIKFRSKKQESAAEVVFQSWELILFENLKKYGRIEPEQYEAVLGDFSAAYVGRNIAKDYLDAQIADMQDQIAEQRTKSA